MFEILPTFMREIRRGTGFPFSRLRAEARRRASTEMIKTGDYLERTAIKEGTCKYRGVKMAERVGFEPTFLARISYDFNGERYPGKRLVNVMCPG